MAMSESESAAITLRAAEIFGRPFLGDPRLDQLMGVVFALAGEVAVLRAEVLALKTGRQDPEAVDRDLAGFVDEILRPLLHEDFRGESLLAGAAGQRRE
jgi:hypothetical protein